MKRHWLVMSIFVGATACSNSDSDHSASSSSGASGAASSGSPGTSSGTVNSPDGGSNPKTSSYKGTFTGAGGAGGEIDFAVSNGSTQSVHIETAPEAVSGTLYVTGGSSVSMSGTYDPSTMQVIISGGPYTFTGTIANNGVTGSFTGPNGSGVFSALTGDVTAYCGTYLRNDGVYKGVWNFIVANGVLSGSAVGTEAGASGKSGTISGTVTPAGAVTLTASDGATGAGNIAGTSVKGTYTDPTQHPGTWQGSSTGCGH